MKQLHIGYFADGVWGYNALKKFLKDDSICVDFVCLRYSNPDNEIEQLAGSNGIDVLCTKNVNEPSFIEQMRVYSSDLYVSMSYDQIFRKWIIKVPEKGIINCHAGKLPLYRGRNILNWVLINDEKEFGITVHFVDEEVDTGDIILQRTYPITDEDTYCTLLEKAYAECPEILYEAIKLIQKDEIKRIRQNEIRTAGLYCGKRQEGDEVIDWGQESRDVFNFVRAITIPGPCARTYVRGNEIRIISSELVPDAPVYKGIPGQVLQKSRDGTFLVKTRDSYIKITNYEGDVKVGDRLVHNIVWGG